ncbi:unnamed protein product [Camellia sinensis]
MPCSFFSYERRQKKIIFTTAIERRRSPRPPCSRRRKSLPAATKVTQRNATHVAQPFPSPLLDLSFAENRQFLSRIITFLSQPINRRSHNNNDSLTCNLDLHRQLVITASRHLSLAFRPHSLTFFLQICPFNKSKMRFPERPILSFCLSPPPPPLPPDFHSLRFHSSIFRTFYRSSGKRGRNYKTVFYVRNWTLGGSRSNLLESWKHNALGFVLLSLKGSCDCHFINASCCHDMGANDLQASYTMDGTGIDGKTSQFQSMTFSDGGTVRKLVYDLKYPPELLEWTFDWKYMVRGLVLDKKWGNILKMDRHKYVKVAYHGYRELLKEDKVATYGSTLIRDTFDEPNYALIDTLFSLAEAYLFAQLVDFKDNNPGKFPEDADLWDYTKIVMNFLCGPQTLDSGSTSNFEWLQYFNVVITGRFIMTMPCGFIMVAIPRGSSIHVPADDLVAKPSFFHDENCANLFEVEAESVMLLNTDNGTPMPQVGGTSMLPLKSLNKNCRVFLGAMLVICINCWVLGPVHRFVLYVGDHIYGDILRSKKVLGWRTMLVVPELEKEVELLWELKDTRKQLQLLGNKRDLVEDKIHHLKWSLKFEGLNDDEEKKLSCKLDKLEDLKESKFVLVTNRLSYNFTKRYFHKVWGQLMKTGYQTSRFAHQVERFACLYTSQVTNLSLYSPNKHYSPSQDFMPHEFEILGM